MKLDAVDRMLLVGEGHDHAIGGGGGNVEASGQGFSFDGQRMIPGDLDTSRQVGEDAAAGVADRVTFQQQDLFKTDLSRASVITMYLLPGVMARLRPVLLGLKPGTRLVSHDFPFDGWKPDRVTQIRKNTFLWIVPAQVEGTWQSNIVLTGGRHTVTLELRQKFQEVDGTARFDDRHAQVWEAHLRGDRLSFVIVDDRDRENEASLYFEGRVSGDVIEGQVRRGTGSGQTVHEWRAVRINAGKTNVRAGTTHPVTVGNPIKEM